MGGGTGGEASCTSHGRGNRRGGILHFTWEGEQEGRHPALHIGGQNFLVQDVPHKRDDLEHDYTIHASGMVVVGMAR